MYGKKGRNKEIMPKRKHKITWKKIAEAARSAAVATARLSDYALHTAAFSPIDMLEVISASSLAGAMTRRASEIVKSIPKEELESQGLSQLPDKLDAILGRLEGIEKEVRGYLGRGERALGDLIPMIVKEYYEAEGYRVKKSKDDADREYKIDLIAERNNEIRAIQAKKGAVSSQEIQKICEKAQIYLKKNISNGKVKTIDIIASRFPIDYLQIRDKIMEKQEEIAVNCIHLYQITQKMPKYSYLGRPTKR